MADNVIGKKSFWNFKKYEEGQWFNSLALLLIFLGILYIILHLTANSISSKNGYEYVRLDKDQMQQINRIYFDTIPGTSLRTNADADSTKKVLQKKGLTNLEIDSITK